MFRARAQQKDEAHRQSAVSGWYSRAIRLDSFAPSWATGKMGPEASQDDPSRSWQLDHLQEWPRDEFVAGANLRRVVEWVKC